jgi:hypothetical protein
MHNQLFGLLIQRSCICKPEAWDYQSDGHASLAFTDTSQLNFTVI